MEDNILSAALDLSKLLKNDPRISKLNQIEQELQNNDEAKILSYKMDVASMNYSDALKIYKHNSNEIKPYLKNLHDAKLKLNELDVVKRYNNAYKEVKELYNKINELVFNDFRFPLNFK